MFENLNELGEDSGVEYRSKKMKRHRSAFTTGQINYLENQFKKCPYIGSAARKELATVLRISERAIKIWFQNRRMKEKKEIINKEHVLDQRNYSINNAEFTKLYSLNNVHTSQSVNDRQCSLQSTVSNQVDKVNSVNYYDKRDSKISNVIKVENLSRPLNYSSSILEGTRKNNYLAQTIGQSILSGPENVDHNMKKVYDDRKLIKYLDKNKKGESKNKATVKQSSKNESSPNHSIIQKKSSKKTGSQDMPEDLSASKLVPNMIFPQNHYGNINLNSTYVPFCNTENVCLSAGNFVWKPVNVMSVVSPNGLPVPEIQPHGMNQNKSNACKCNCNCTIRNRLNYHQGLTTPQPQYVIAIPYSNSDIL